MSAPEPIQPRPFREDAQTKSNRQVFWLWVGVILPAIAVVCLSLFVWRGCENERRIDRIERAIFSAP